MERNVIILGADMSSSLIVDNKNKDITILGEGPTQRLGDTTLTSEAKHSINFTQTNKRFVLNLHYNGSKAYELCLYHANINVDLKEENAIQINCAIMINVELSLQNVMYAEKILGILLHVVVKIGNT